MSILEGVRIVEFAGIGPGPFCGMLLADLGAEVILIERKDAVPGDPLDFGEKNILNRGKRSVGLDLKSPKALEAALRLVESADALIEGMRPGVMERLGLGPEVCLKRNPRLVYGRMTGWGQTGPLSKAAGHDNNYIAVSGALWWAGQPGSEPVAPATLVGDLGGGALYLAVGILAGILKARATGKGDVVDAAIVDGSAHLLNLLLSMKAGGIFSFERGKSALDGSHWFNTYRTKDSGFVNVGPVEPKFYRMLLEKLGVADDPAFFDQYGVEGWPALREKFAEIFMQKTRAEWQELLEGTDVCFGVVLSPEEAGLHPHNAARNTYSTTNGLLQTNPAPRFASANFDGPKPVPARGAHTHKILSEAGFSEEEIGVLRDEGGI